MYSVLEMLKRFFSESRVIYAGVQEKDAGFSISPSGQKYVNRKITRKSVNDKQTFHFFMVYLNLSVKGTVNMFFKEI